MNELKNNGLKSLNFSMEVIETKVGHWVEMNWHDVKELGCGIANCAHAEKANPTDQWTFVVCEYNPGKIFGLISSFLCGTRAKFKLLVDL